VFSEDIENVLVYLESVASKGLRKRNDLGRLLELAADRGADQEMNELTFHGRHLSNLYNTLRRGQAGTEGYDVLEREFRAATERLRDLIAAMMTDADEATVERFNTQYYAMTQGSLRNLVDLACDLGVLKGVQNDNRRGA
jgi:hypothetical protein